MLLKSPNMLLCKKIKQLKQIGIVANNTDDWIILLFELFKYYEDFDMPTGDQYENFYRLYRNASKCRNPTKEPWNRSLQDIIFKENLKKINPRIIEREKLKLELGCPGDVDYQSGSLKSYQVNKPTFGYTDRPTIQVKSLTPGPGSYGKNHVPDQLFQETKGQFLSFSNIPLFEKYQCGRNPCKKLSLLPPNLYCPVDKNSISVRLLTKNVSKRGPYDLFTGPRTNENNKSYFGQSNIKKSYCSKKFYDIPSSSLDQLINDPKYARRGKFMKATRFKNYVFELDPLENNQILIKPSPTPATYTPTFPRGASYKDKVKRYPFNSSNYNVRPDTFDPVIPGPGRYVSTLSTVKCKSKNSWPFLTKYTRNYFQPPKSYNSF